eukprot:ctg_578.g254
MSSGKRQRTDSSRYDDIFGPVAAELDAYKEKRERLVKASRDTTAAAKKVIFKLLRVNKVVGPTARTLDDPLLDEAEEDLAAVRRKIVDDIAAEFVADPASSLTEEYWRYQPQFSTGLQEYIEAAAAAAGAHRHDRLPAGRVRPHRRGDARGGAVGGTGQRATAVCSLSLPAAAAGGVPGAETDGGAILARDGQLRAGQEAGDDGIECGESRGDLLQVAFATSRVSRGGRRDTAAVGGRAESDGRRLSWTPTEDGVASVRERRRRLAWRCGDRGVGPVADRPRHRLPGRATANQTLHVIHTPADTRSHRWAHRATPRAPADATRRPSAATARDRRTRRATAARSSTPPPVASPSPGGCRQPAHLTAALTPTCRDRCRWWRRPPHRPSARPASNTPAPDRCCGGRHSAPPPPPPRRRRLGEGGAVHRFEHRQGAVAVSTLAATDPTAARQMRRAKAGASSTERACHRAPPKSPYTSPMRSPLPHAEPNLPYCCPMTLSRRRCHVPAHHAQGARPPT